MSGATDTRKGVRLSSFDSLGLMLCHSDDAKVR